MIKIVIFEQYGVQSVYLIDPQHLPEWYVRWISQRESEE